MDALKSFLQQHNLVSSRFEKEIVNMLDDVKIYKVCLPSYYAYPSSNVILKVCFTAEEAQAYIDTYPNVFLRMWLTIESQKVEYKDTD